MTLPFMDVRDFGTIHTADDTATLADAITAANAADEMLYLPSGKLNIQLGALPEIKSSWWGPQATIKALNSASAPLLTINLPTRCRFTLRGIEGASNGVGNYAGHGLYIKQAADSFFDILNINNFGIGIWCDGGGNPYSHISTNDFHIMNLFECHRGIQLSSGIDDDHQTEANRFSINYAHHFTEQVVKIGDSPYATACDENSFDFGTVEVLFPNADAFTLDATAKRNRFAITNLFGGISGSGVGVRTAAGTLNNTFNLCRYNGIPMAVSGFNILDVSSGMTDGLGRSIYNVTAKPPDTFGEEGAVARQVNLAAGTPALWGKAVDGTWRVIATMA